MPSVLARDTIGHATYLNRYFQLRIADAVIEGLADYTQFIALEQMRTFVQRNKALATEFNRVAKEAKYTELVQHLRVPVASALTAMQEIAKRYPFRYVTCRYEATMQITRTWLARYGFPDSENVSCCEKGMYQKYLVAHQRTCEDKPLVFINDLAETFMKSFAPLVKYHYQETKAIRKCCGLLAFGHSQAPAWPFRQSMYAVSPLLNWAAFERLIGAGKRTFV